MLAEANQYYDTTILCVKVKIYTLQIIIILIHPIRVVSPRGHAIICVFRKAENI